MSGKFSCVSLSIWQFASLLSQLLYMFGSNQNVMGLNPLLVQIFFGHVSHPVLVIKSDLLFNFLNSNIIVIRKNTFHNYVYSLYYVLFGMPICTISSASFCVSQEHLRHFQYVHIHVRIIHVYVYCVQTCMWSCLNAVSCNKNVTQYIP